ncbi:MAG TPA: cupin domain-containing protein [Candidatus Polarisedimenticolaceae bacterium]|nr:cupin domain-containing protein [Candidatus Polarisedimenticolaceae bacterium]
MYHMVNPSERPAGALAAVAFEGERYGAGVSYFRGELPPGKGPGLHRHPYPETCIVLAGRAEMVVDGERLVASAGDTVVIATGTPHAFVAIGDEPLAMVAVHASDRIVIEWLSEQH